MDNLNEIETISLQNEAILNLFYDLPFIGMAITSPTTHRWLKFNDRLCEIYGYSREELPHIAWTKITHPDDLDLDLAEYEKVMRDESDGYVMDKRYIRKDGQIIYASIDVKAVRKEDRTVDFFVATVQDISDRKLAEAQQMQIEKALAESEERYRQVVQTQIDFVMRSLPDTTITFVNESLCRALGMSLDQVIGLKWIDFAPPDELQSTLQKVSTLSPINPSFLGENHDKRADGQIGFTQWINQGIFDDRGQLIGLQSAGRDITALKNAENDLQKLNEELERRIEERTGDLKQSEARNLAILQSLPDLLLILKRDGTCVDCILPSTFDKAKYVPIQNHISEVLPPETLALQLQISEKAIATGEIQIYEHQLSKFGKIVHEEVRISPYRDDEVLVIVRDISDRKQAEQLLLKSDTHLKVAQRIGKVGSWEFEINTGKLTWSDEIFRIYGLQPSPEPPNYDELQRYIYPDDLELFNETVQNAINLAQSYDLEHRLVQPNGTLIYVMARGEMIYDASGQLTHIIGTAMDISDRKQAEQLLLKSDTHLKAAQRISKLGSWEFDLQTGEVIWSEEVFRIFGRDHQTGTPTYQELQSYIHPDDWEYFNEVVKQAIATAQSYDVDYRVCWADGTLVYISARGEIICDPMGQAIQIIGTVMDISDRKLAEQQLQDVTARLTLAVKSAAVGIWEWDIVNNCLIWDERTYELYGIIPDPMIDAYLAWANRVHPSDRPSAEIAVQMALNGEKDYETEFRIILPDDSIRYLKAYALVQRNQAGEPQRLIGINFDITEHKQSEAKILETAHQLANTNRELETFSYSVSHDLRAPLRHMNGFVNALQQQLQKHHDVLNDPKVAHYLQVIERSSQKMGNLIDGLLSLSRYGRRPIESKQLSIRELVDEAIDMIRSDPHYNSSIEFAIADLPIKYGDRALLQQVFHNLIGNAVKFSRNQLHPCIVIDTLPDGTIRIKDNGVGFQMEYADKLFGAFQRLHTESEFEGTGIGLAIVQRIVQRHGGSVWAEGSPNQGAAFFVKI